MSTPLPALRSLRFRLPLLISAMIVVVLGLFLWATNRALERTLEQTGADRARAAADQVASLLSQSSVRGIGDARRAAGDAAVRAYLEAPSPERAEAARHVLTPLASASQPPVEVWNAAGEHMLDVTAPPARDGKPAPGLPPGAAPTRAGLTPFHLDHTVLYELTAEVDEAATRAAGAAARVDRHAPRPDGAGHRRVNRPVGSGALLAVGNQAGGV